MGLLENALSVLTPRRKGKHLSALEEGIGFLRLSTFYALERKYLSDFRLDTAKALAVAVVSTLTLEAPADDRFRRFCKKYAKDISEQARKLQGSENLCGLSGCASYLCAAEMLRCKIKPRNSTSPGTKRSSVTREALQQRADDLGILVPTNLDICGSDDDVKCIYGIRSFAKAFYYANTWVGSSTNLVEVQAPLDGDEVWKDILLGISPALPDIPFTPHCDSAATDPAPAYQLSFETPD